MQSRPPRTHCSLLLSTSRPPIPAPGLHAFLPACPSLPPPPPSPAPPSLPPPATSLPVPAPPPSLPLPLTHPERDVPQSRLVLEDRLIAHQQHTEPGTISGPPEVPWVPKFIVLNHGPISGTTCVQHHVLQCRASTPRGERHLKDETVTSSQTCMASGQACMASGQTCMASGQACMASGQACMASGQACMASGQACMAYRDTGRQCLHQAGRQVGRQAGNRSSSQAGRQPI